MFAPHVPYYIPLLIHNVVLEDVIQALEAAADKSVSFRIFLGMPSHPNLAALYMKR